MDKMDKKSDAVTEQNYKQLFSQAPAPIAIYKGRELRYIFVNEAYSKIFNHREILGKTVREAFPELEGQAYYSILENVFDHGITYYGNETPALIDMNNDGVLTTRYYNLVYTPYKNSNGIVEGIMAFGHDVTDQVTARQKIEYAEEKARLAIESADLGAYEVNLITHKMITSPRFRAIWGVDDTTDRSQFAAVIHPDDLSVREQAHKKSIETGNLHYEARVIWKDKSEHWVKIKGKVLYDEKQKPVKLLGVIQDITEQKLFSEELTKKVEDRTKELQEAKERLERSNAELEQFAYITSHDLQEPLRKIQVFNDMLQEKSIINEQGKRYAGKIDESAKRMTGLIKDLLNYSRLSHSGMQFEETPLQTVLENVLSDFELLITQKKAVIETDRLDTIEAIPLQMNQLFSNLIGNALKFSKGDTSPLIQIKANKLSPDEKKKLPSLNTNINYYKIQIKDNGIGFEQEYGEKIFTIFQRLNQQNLFGGYGIGLALCRKIVSNHNGLIYAEGKPDEGAGFTVILPYQQTTKFPQGE
jgi:PAS domain S-box-containing protein